MRERERGREGEQEREGGRAGEGERGREGDERGEREISKSEVSFSYYGADLKIH